MADPVTADVQRELAEALARANAATPDAWMADAAALLPVVQALIADAEKRAAARALRDAAEDWDANTNHVCDAPHELRDRAAALDPSGAAEGAGR